MLLGWFAGSPYLSSYAFARQCPVLRERAALPGDHGREHHSDGMLKKVTPATYLLTRCAMPGANSDWAAVRGWS